MDYEVDIELEKQSPINVDLRLETSGISEHNLLKNRDLPDQHPISAITGLQEALDTIPDDYVSDAELESALLEKQDVISDLATIRSGAELGTTAVQPNDNISELVNNAGYITNSALSGYATETYVDTGLANKQDTLVSGTNIKTINSTSVLGSGNFALADQGLSNLDSAGQLIIDTQNGTISNCVLEIPQNIKLTLENNVLTLKAGSECVLYGSTYQTVTKGSDLTRYFPNSIKNKTFVIMPNIALNYIGFLALSHITSGESFPIDLPSSGQYGFYKVSEKQLYETEDGGTTWSVSGRTYPICIINIDSNGVASFAKDSNGNDMIFNGAGFIGHHAFVYPNVSGLTPQKFNNDGTLKSGLRTNTSLAIIEMNQGQYGGYNRVISLIAGNPTNNAGSYIEIDTRADVKNVAWVRQYIKNENVIVARTPSDISEFLSGIYPPQTPLIEYNYDGTTVTDFTIRQPVRTVTVEMLDSVQSQVNTKQADITTITGYDATKTQTLKNVSGVLTWVDDGE